MHIKTIQIQGFKSYKNQIFKDEFNAEVNSIVGRNGSGKSNFFSAIQFVLSEKYSKLKAEERQAFLHEGTGRGVMSAFVEIVFDNSDNRLPIDKREVAIRRTIGLKKDEYRIDSKSVTQKEVLNLLESAGFSSSNPYYIVEQGKVSLLTTMKDVDRLNLLKEIAGTKIYDERRKESLKIMQNTSSKLEQINEVIETVEDRLKDLEKEKKELKNYQILDKDRRSIEYTLYDKELAEAIEHLDQIEKSRHETHNTSAKLHADKATFDEEIQEMEKTLNDTQVELNDQKRIKDVFSDERQDLIKSKTQLELEIKDLKYNQTNESEAKTKAKQEMKSLKNRIKDAENKLKKIDPNYQKIQKDENEIQESLNQKDRRLKALYFKGGRKFKTLKERNIWIQNEVKEKSSTLKLGQEQFNGIKSEIESLERELKLVENKIEEKSKNVEDKKSFIREKSSEYIKTKDARDQLTNDRKGYWKVENEISKKVQKTEEEINHQKKKLESTFSNVINKGIQEVWKIVREQGINSPNVQVYGTVIELFDCDEIYSQAVEVTAQNSLFNIVVESSDVAARIIKIINQQKSPGRVTFMPLNRINVEDRTYPESNSFIPIIEKLNYDKKFDKVFKHIFGKTVISDNLESAGSFARNNNLNCVTLSGDQVNSKGALTGGFYDVRNSRLDIMRNMKKSKNLFDEDEKQQKKIKIQLSEIDNKINLCVGELLKLEEELNKNQNTITQETIDLKTLTSRQKTLVEILSQRQKSISSLEVTIKNLEETIKSLNEEKNTQLHSELTNNEQKEIENLNVEITKLKDDLVEISETKAQLEIEKNELENVLERNLNLRQDELNETIDTIGTIDSAEKIDSKEKELDTIISNIEDFSSKQKDVEEKIDELNQQIRNQTEEIEKLRTKEISQSKKLQDKSNSFEKLLNKRKIWNQKKEECIHQIRQLGTLPTDHDKFEEDSTKELMEKLHDIKEKLKKYEHVNKKALDQYEQFSEQRDDFLKKKEELDHGQNAIENLVKVLDQRKDETIIRTFKQVKKNFSEIFSEIVPDGEATLIMNSSEEELSVSKCTGVSISVKFSGDGEKQYMQQLSGGQKSLVALTLIFAIQKCDPAPFYLFDEIDAALDSAHRLSVAKMIKKQSESTQFIIASFKKEMLDIADQFYAISFKNKVSQITSSTKKDSLIVLEEQSTKIDEEEEEDTQIDE
eukprot:gene3454-6103_t